MKLRVDKSQIEFYINKLIRKGYHKTSDIRSSGKYEVTLQKDDRVISLTFTRNGWLTIS